MTVKNANRQIKMLRLRRGARYVVAFQDISGKIDASPYWDAAHALAANDIHPSLWNAVPTEVFNEHLSNELPTGSFIFSRRERKGSFRGAVLWHGKIIYPSIFSSIEHAVAAAWLAVSNQNSPPFKTTFLESKPIEYHADSLVSRLVTSSEDGLHFAHRSRDMTSDSSIQEP